MADEARVSDARPRFDDLFVDVNLATFDPLRSGDWGEVRGAVLATHAGRIAWIGRAAQFAEAFGDDPAASARRVHSMQGAWATPGWIDAHTHLVFGGTRADEFAQRMAGASYAEIAAHGGGIARTVALTRAESPERLAASARARALELLREGVTTLEAKSGYAGTVAGELAQLEAARAAGRGLPVEVRATLLGLHFVPPEFARDQSGWVRVVADELVPAAAAAGLAHQVDAFLEGIAFTQDECATLFEAARAHGLGLRLHADQLSDGGGAAFAATWGAASADHLERANAHGLEAMARAGTVAVLLPGAYLGVRDDTPPPVALMRELGVGMAVATDQNPGTSPVRSLRAALHLACTLFGLTPAEAVAGVTREAARALGLADDRGMLAVGLRADVAFWAVDDPAELAYWLGGELLSAVAKDGLVRTPSELRALV